MESLKSLGMSEKSSKGSSNKLETWTKGSGKYAANYKCLNAEDLAILSSSKAPVPYNEAERIFALRQTQLLDSDTNDPMFDRFTSLAQRLFDVPIALVSLVDINRQWFKSNVGLDG
jgi:hypothetical protein